MYRGWVLVFAVAVLFSLSIPVVVPVFASSEDCWVSKASMQQARSILGVATVNGKIYAIGGSNANGFAASAVNEQYLPIGYGTPDPTYQTPTPIPTPAPSPALTSTPTLTPTPTPPTFSPTPTETPTSTASSSASPSKAPEPTPPTILYVIVAVAVVAIVVVVVVVVLRCKYQK